VVRRDDERRAGAALRHAKGGRVGVVEQGNRVAHGASPRTYVRSKGKSMQAPLDAGGVTRAGEAGGGRSMATFLKSGLERDRKKWGQPAPFHTRGGERHGPERVRSR